MNPGLQMIFHRLIDRMMVWEFFTLPLLLAELYISQL